MIYKILGLIIGVVGTVIAIKTIGFLPILGIFLMIWGNNIGRIKKDEK